MKLVIMIFLILVNLYYGVTMESRNRCVQIKFGNINRKVEYGNILSLALIGYFLYLVNTVENVYDYSQYEWIYSSKSQNIEWGYIFLEELGYKFGFDFSEFRILLFVVGYLFLYSGIKKLEINSNIVLAIYSIYPLTIDIIQMRNFLALSIVVFGLNYLALEDKLSKCKYVLCIIIASSIHVLSIVFLILLLADKKIESKNRKRIISILLVFMFVLIIFMKIFNSNLIITNILSLINADKTNYYTTQGINWGFLVYFVMELGYLLTWKGINDSYKLTDTRDSKKTMFFYWLNLSLILTFPLCLVNINFYRIYRNFSLINYAAIQFIARSKNLKNRMMFIVLFIITFILNFSIDIIHDMENLFLIFFKE